MLTVDDVTFLYRENRGVASVSFNVKAGECVGVIGENGVGKSTLLGLLAAALLPQFGTIQLTTDAHKGRVRRYHTHLGIGYRRHVGYLTELGPAYEEMSVFRYLRVRACLRGERFLRIRRRVNEAMERCGLTEMRDERIGRLSQGIRRRVALAEAILTMPQILILDDPFAGIDAKMRADFVKIIKAIQPTSHVIISGHDRALLAACCSRFILLQKDTPGVVEMTPQEANAILNDTPPTTKEQTKGATK
ncbi:MAG: ABC transporter ATP-binding protein [bacterium]|nr:ABC transporter ATP-binding protein [bacterium]MDO5462564.1 ABC transporter ATP-binding protein [bacterium]